MEINFLEKLTENQIEPMKILQILPELNVGGVETGTVDLAKYLVEHGHQALVVSNGGALVGELEQNGVRHLQLPVHRKSLWTMLQCVRRLSEFIRAEKVDLVHARSRVPAWIAFFACRRTKTVFVTTCHGYYTPHGFSRVMSWGKLVIAISEVIGRHLVSSFGTPPEKIRVIPRSVDLKKFSQISKSPQSSSAWRIAIIGRLTPLKGHEYFLKAMSDVVRQFPFAKIWIIGDAPASRQGYKEHLQFLANRLGLSEHVEFLGNRRDIPQLLAETQVLVLATTTQEAFGRVILEAQAVGVPVVATRVGGVVEIIEHEQSGLLVPPKDPRALAEAVMRIFKEPKLAGQLVIEAKKKLLEKYTLDKMAEATLQIYSEALHSQNILVIKLSAVGDAVLITPSLRALRNKFPQGKIYCLVGKEAGSVLKRCPYVDGLIVYDFKGKDRGLKAFWELGRELRRYRFDKVVDFQNNRRSHGLAALSLAHQTYGYDNGKGSFLLSEKIKDNFQALPPVEHQFQVLGMLGIGYKPELSHLELWPSEQEGRYIQELLDAEWLGNNPCFIGMNLSASAKWKTKNWPVESMARLCDLLATENIRVLLTGEKKDLTLARELLGLTHAKPANFVGKTNLLQLACLIGRCRAYVTPDSAPMHLAAAMNVPLIALFGPTDASRHLPPASQAHVFQRTLPCAPCYSTTCRIKTHLCMRQITAEEVAEKVRAMLKTPCPQST